MKAPKYKLYELLSRLPQSISPWQDIIIDFIINLPSVERQEKIYTLILIVINRFSKIIRFILYTKDVTSKNLASIFINKIIKDFGVLKLIINNRGSIFTS